MREIILAGAFALSTSTCLAQTATPPAPISPIGLANRGGCLATRPVRPTCVRRFLAS